MGLTGTTSINIAKSSENNSNGAGSSRLRLVKLALSRAWSAIARFFENCKKNIPGKKGFPKFKRTQTHGSVEYKVDGWLLSDDRLTITFRDGFKAGTFKMWGTRDLHFYQKEQIKRVRVVRRADGYYVQFSIDQERNEKHEPTNRMLGVDVGLSHFYTDSDGKKIENPRFLRKAEKALKKAQKRVSRRTKGSKNRIKAIKKLGREHLKVSRRRKDFAVKTARALVQSADLVAIEDLKVRNLVKNHHLAKSISDASWTLFRQWLEYFGKVFDVPVIAVAPHYTSLDCSNCGRRVRKTLSTRTHKCSHCGYLDDRDTNAAINILMKALQGIAQLPLAKRASVPARRGTRKVTSGERLTSAEVEKSASSKSARRDRNSRQ